MLSAEEVAILNDEAVALAGNDALLRGKKKKAERGHESARPFYESSHIVSIQEATRETDGKGKEGPIATVTLISEGLGNLRDKNYYGPEAIQSAPRVFEGVQMMLNHQSYSEERDRPEGDVQNTVAYFKNLRVEKQPNGRLACVGEAHFDLSSEGLNAFQKARTAVHYANEFPKNGREYVGLSVNASGESESRTMTIDGEEMEVNYVMRFVEARSCDMVTIPARGGKFVATVESITGARLLNKEVRMKTVETLQKILTGLAEAEKLDEGKTPDLRQKISEARKSTEALMKEILESAERHKTEEAERKKKEAAEAEARRKKEDESKDEDEDESESDDGDEDDDKPANKKKKKAESGGRSHELAVKQLVSESGLNVKYFDVDELNGMTLKEAEREISRVKRIHEAHAAELVERFGEVPAVTHAKESGRTKEEKVEPVNNADFASLSSI